MDAPRHGPRRRHAVLASVSAAALASTPALATAANPFATVYDDGPPPFAVGMRAGSVHDLGIGAAVGVVPWEHLQLQISYAYWTEHSVAGLVAVTVLPRAALSPQVSAGYELGVGRLPYGISLFTHRLVAGVGVQARIASRWFVAAEVTGNGAVAQMLKDRTSVREITPSDRFIARPGFAVGAYLP